MGVIGKHIAARSRPGKENNTRRDSRETTVCGRPEITLKAALQANLGRRPGFLVLTLLVFRLRIFPVSHCARYLAPILHRGGPRAQRHPSGTQKCVMLPFEGTYLSCRKPRWRLNLHKTLPWLYEDSKRRESYCKMCFGVLGIFW